MAVNLTVRLEDRPGALAELGEATGRADVNVEGLACEGGGGGRVLAHLLVPDARAARAALTEAGFGVESEREVLLVDLEDRPGAMGEAARKIADAGINIEIVYLATRTRLVLGVNDPDKARSTLG